MGTPGRVLDLLNRNKLSLEEIEVLVLDETDQMLDKGFQEDLETILKFLKNQRQKNPLQTLLFSATLPQWVKKISEGFLRPGYYKADLVPSKFSKTPHQVKHFSLLFFDQSKKAEALPEIVMVHGGFKGRTIIFTETKA